MRKVYSSVFGSVVHRLKKLWCALFPCLVFAGFWTLISAFVKNFEDLGPRSADVAFQFLHFAMVSFREFDPFILCSICSFLETFLCYVEWLSLLMMLLLLVNMGYVSSVAIDVSAVVTVCADIGDVAAL